MKHLAISVLTVATALNTTPAHADLGDVLYKLLADDGTVDDIFGSSVAINSTTTIVGAHVDNDNGDFSGSAYLFDTATGKQIFKLLPNDGAEGDSFGYSVAISGLTAIVGAPGNDDNGINSGSAYLFDTTTGQQITKLLAKDGEAGDSFGVSVTISANIAIVGAHADDDNGNTSGSAYMFDITDPMNPVQIVKLLPDDGATFNLFGVSVAISGAVGKERVIIGAYGDDDNGSNSGSAYLFDTTTGLQIAKLMPDDGATLDEFGYSVAISGTIAIVGAYADDDNGIDSGSAYLFDISVPANPIQIGKCLADEGSTDDNFGFSVAISGPPGKEIAIVGARWDDDNGNNSGSAYLFDATTGQQIAKLIPNDGEAGDFFGHSVAISGITAIVGMIGDDDNGEFSGSAYLIDVALIPP